MYLILASASHRFLPSCTFETCISHPSIQLGFGFKASYNAFKSYCGFTFTLPSGLGKDYNLKLLSLMCGICHYWPHTSFWLPTLMAQAWHFSVLGAVSSYFVCSLPGFRGYYRGNDTWCRRHPLCCSITLVRFAFLFLYSAVIVGFVWALLSSWASILQNSSTNADCSARPAPRCFGPSRTKS